MNGLISITQPDNTPPSTGQKGKVMKNDIFKEITMQEHKDLFGPVECDKCGGAMKPFTNTQIFDLTNQGVKVKVSGIQAHKCDGCGNVIISSMETVLIEMEVRKALAQDTKEG